MSERLRILHVGNGRAFKIKAIVDAFVQRGHEVHMVPIPPLREGWSGVAWHCLPPIAVPGPAKVLARFAQIRSLAKRVRPDIVHAHNAWGPGWFGAVAGVRPFVIHAYGGDVLSEQYGDRPAYQRWLTAWACRAADRIVVTGQHMVEAAKRLGVAPEQVMVLPRGVDLDLYRPGLDATPLRARLQLEDCTPIVLSPRYQVDEPLYNLDVVVEAFARVRARFPKAACVQLYDPRHESGRARLGALAVQRGVGGAYLLVPAVDNQAMPLFYNAADVVVSVPSSDGFPVSVLEASACGVPLIVSDLPYCAEWFVNGRNGMVVPVRDPTALAAAVLAVCFDRDLARRLGASGRQMVEERADYRRCMDTLETEYRRLVAVARRHPVGAH